MKNINNNLVVSACSISSFTGEGGGIYLIKVPGCNKYYIGKTKNFKKRWTQHLRDLNKKQHHCKPLQIAYESLLDKNTIVFAVIYSGKPSLKKEKEYMNKLGANNLFNTKVIHIRKNDYDPIYKDNRIADMDFAIGLKNKLLNSLKESGYILPD